MNTPDEDERQPLVSKSSHSVDEVISALGSGRFFLHMHLLIAVLSFLNGWAGGIGPFLVDALEDRFGADSATKSHVLLIAGIGSIWVFLVASLADVIGRMLCLALIVLACGVALLGHAFATSIAILALLMTVDGAFHFANSRVKMSLLSEWTVRSIRGGAMTIMGVYWNLGRIASTGMVFALPLAENWVVFFVLLSLPFFLVFPFVWWKAKEWESPRFLLVCGRNEEALQVLQGAAKTNDVDISHVKRVHLQVEGMEDAEPAHDHEHDSSTFARLKQLLLPRYLLAVLSQIALWFCLNYTSGGMFMWMIMYLKESNREEYVPKSYIAAPLAKILGSLAATLIIDRYRRLPVVAVSLLVQGIATLLLMGVHDITLFVVCYAVQNFFEEIIWNVGGVYTTEWFPTTIRTTATSVVFKIGGLGRVVAHATGAVIMDKDQSLPVLTYGLSSLVGCLVVLLFLRGDRTNRSLADTA